MKESWGECRAGCQAEGDLRAYLDRELAPERMTEIAVHLGGCMECHARYNQIAGRAARVADHMAACLEAVEFRAATAASAQPRRMRPPRLAAAVLALAAATAAAFVLLPKRTVSPRPVASPHVAPIRPVMQQASAKQPDRLQPPPTRPKTAKRAKPAPVQYYLALDDEPIDTGVVMRVAFDGTGVQADVIFDADGRPRAIRTVK